MNQLKITGSGIYQNEAWTIESASGRFDSRLWFVYRTGSLTRSAWTDLTAKPFLTFEDAKQFAEAN